MSEHLMDGYYIHVLHVHVHVYTLHIVHVAGVDISQEMGLYTCLKLKINHEASVYRL